MAAPVFDEKAAADYFSQLLIFLQARAPDQPRSAGWHQALASIVRHEQSWHAPFEVSNQPLDLRVLNLDATTAGEQLGRLLFEYPATNKDMRDADRGKIRRYLEATIQPRYPSPKPCDPHNARANFYDAVRKGWLGAETEARARGEKS